MGTTLLFKGPKGRFRYERGSKKAIGAPVLTFLYCIVKLCGRYERGSKKAIGAPVLLHN